MKRYLIIGIMILAIIIAYNVLSIYTGIYINFNKKDVNNNVYVDNKKIYINNEELKIKGVEINSCYPGHNFSDYKIDKETYLKWFNQIQEMGANTIKATNRFNPEFYEALYEFNKRNEKPLYLLQCIEIEEYDTNNSDSIYGYKDKLIKEALITIDAVHGNRYIVTSGIASKGFYSKDVSQWTIGYIITNIGKEETIAYTDNTDKRMSDKGYNGKYFYTNPNEASETECIVAEIMDKMTNYETNKYNNQKLLSLMIDTLKDPFIYKDNVNIQLGKMAYINMNNIKTKDNLKTGKVVSYNISEDINTNFLDILSESDVVKYQDILNTIQKDSIFNGYIDFINKYYDSPVLIASFGFSTSRIIDKEYETAITEKQQGEQIIKYYDEFIKDGACGGIISSWQDNWSITTWNIKYSTIEEKEINWFNKNSIDQCRGILAFESENRQNICYVDGDISEWNEEDLISNQNDIKLYCKYDLENLYIMVKNIKNNNLLIPIDITNNSGSEAYKNIKFNRNVDFLININGKEDSEILVQEYYDSIRAMYEDNISGIKQYSNVPDKNTDNFVNIRGLLKRQVDPNINISLMTPEKRIQYRMYKVYNVGKLRYGNNNPNSLEYNSLSDYCFGKNCVEIQIPWQSLNFSSPSEMLVHDDYYKNYGVEDIKIDKMYIGAGYNISNNKINLNELKLEPWTRNVKVQERLKQSYNIIKEYWCKE